MFFNWWHKLLSKYYLSLLTKCPEEDTQLALAQKLAYYMGLVKNKNHL